MSDPIVDSRERVAQRGTRSRHLAVVYDTMLDDGTSGLLPVVRATGCAREPAKGDDAVAISRIPRDPRAGEPHPIDRAGKLGMLKPMWAAYFESSRTWQPKPSSKPEPSSRSCGLGGTPWAMTLALFIGLCGSEARAQTYQFPPPSPAPRPIEAASVTPAQGNGAMAPFPATQPNPASTAPSPPGIPAEPALSRPPTRVPATPSSTGQLEVPGQSSAAPPGSPNLGLQPLGAPAAWPPALLPYREGMPIPQGYRLDSRVNAGLVYGGIVTWAVPYATGLIAAAASGFEKRSGWVALPIAGPFIAITGRTIDCTFLGTSTSPSVDIQQKEDACRKSAIREVRAVVLLTLDGLLQTTGAMLAIAGLMSPHEYLLRNDLFPPDTKLSFDAGYSHDQFRFNARLVF